MEHGKWVEQDADGAVQLYSQAAEQGHSRAALLLGICCLNGTGMPRDPDRAWDLLVRAWELGAESAACELGQMCICLLYTSRCV